MLNLNIGTITYPDGWKSVNDNAVHKFKSSYTEGDSIGMYVVDKNNKVIEENLKFTYKDGKWIVDPEKKFKCFPQSNYFVYYPYQKGGLPGAPTKDTPDVNVTSAASFFDKAIKAWCNKFDTSKGQTIDQSDIPKMNSFDLQIGKADGLGESATTIDFNSMEHAMGLAEIVLGEKTVDHNYHTQPFGKAGVYAWRGGKIGVYASNKITGYNPFNIANHKYVTIVRPQGFADATKLETAVSDVDGWKEPLSFSPLGNHVQTLTAENKRWSVSTDHPIGLGDIFYNDGSISKDLTGQTITSGHFPVGIVVYLAENNDGTDQWAETNTAGSDIGGHGLVMCLKTIGSTGPTNFGNDYAYSSYGNPRFDEVTSKSDIVNSKNKTSGSGYTNTNYLANESNSKTYAAYQAMNYKELPINSYLARCTGWFLPSAGQYYAALSQLGGGGMSSDWKLNTDINVTTEINDMLEKVGGSNYTYFFQKGDICEWTSSYCSTYTAVAIYSGIDDSKGSGSVRFVDLGKIANYIPVRPFLAF